MYGDGMQVRDWLHVSDHAAGIDFVLRHGAAGEAYNVAGGTELPNREVIGRLLAATGRDWSLVRTVPDRPGHDRRYAMDGSKLAALGWAPRSRFDDGPAGDGRLVPRRTRTGSPARSRGDWDAYYARQYGDRLAAGRAVDGTGLTGARRGRRGRRPARARAGRRRSRRRRSRARAARSAGTSPSSSSTRSPRHRFGALLDRERPEVVIHTAAWTDVDGCAREPELAMRRNGTAVGEIARACAGRGIGPA